MSRDGRKTCLLRREGRERRGDEVPSGFPPPQHETGKLGPSEEESKYEIPPLGNNLGLSGQSQLALNRRK